MTSVPTRGTYIVRPAGSDETARQVYSDQFVTERLMGGLFPERSSLEGITRILDLACGMGYWLCEVARTYPHVEVVGIDNDASIIAAARSRAKELGVGNVTFLEGDVLLGVAAPAHSVLALPFDLINARFLWSFMPKTAWPMLLGGCRNLLRPGGVLRLTEPEFPLVTTPALGRLGRLVCTALAGAGMSHAPTGRNIGLMAKLGALLGETGYRHVGTKTYMVDFSIGTSAHEGGCSVLSNLLPLLTPFLVNQSAMSQGELENLIASALGEMNENDFCAVVYARSAWGETNT